MRGVGLIGALVLLRPIWATNYECVMGPFSSYHTRGNMSLEEELLVKRDYVLMSI